MEKKEKEKKDIPGSDPGGLIETTDPDHVTWGTDSLEDKFEYRGRISSTSWTKTKDFGKGCKDQLVLEIQPISYDGSIKKAYYPLSKKPSSKWGMLQRALEECGLRGEQSIGCHEDLVDLVLDFEDREVVFGKDRDGNPIKSRMTLPVRWVRDIEEYGEKLDNEDIDDLEASILNIVKETPKPITDLYTKLEDKASKKDVLSAVKTLEAAGKVIFEEGIVIGV